MEETVTPKPDRYKLPYELTKRDLNQFALAGKVPVQVFKEFIENGKKLLPEHQQPLVTEIVSRYLKGKNRFTYL